MGMEDLFGNVVVVRWRDKVTDREREALPFFFRLFMSHGGFVFFWFSKQK
jgi:hypothetical protein